MSMLHDLIQADLFGGGSGGSGSQNAVLYTEQTLTDAQKAQARTNIGAGEPVDAVLYTQQSLTDAQKEQARTNIGAGEPSDGMERFLVTFTHTPNGFVSNKTLAEITTAQAAGKYIEGTYDGQYCPLVKLTSTAATFQMLVRGTNEVQFDQLVVLENGCMADRTDLGLATVFETISETAVNLDPEVNHYYKCGTLTSLSVDSLPSSGSWSVRFTSGSTATVLTMPNEVEMPDGFEVEANAVYEINVLDNYALVASWPVPVE